VAAAAVPA
jgi:hypothetical protein